MMLPSARGGCSSAISTRYVLWVNLRGDFLFFPLGISYLRCMAKCICSARFCGSESLGPNVYMAEFSFSNVDTATGNQRSLLAKRVWRVM